MADEPTPTYGVMHDGDTTTYTCLVPDANGPDGVCGHWATDLALMTQHMQQRHQGLMHEAPPPEQVEEEAPAPAHRKRRRGGAAEPVQNEAEATGEDESQAEQDDQAEAQAEAKE